MGYTYDYSVYVDYTLCMYLHVLDELDTILPKVNWVSLHMQSIHSLGIDHIWTCDIIKLRQEWYLLSERLFIYTFHIRVFPDVRQTLFGPFKYVWDILCLPFFGPKTSTIQECWFIWFHWWCFSDSYRCNTLHNIYLQLCKHTDMGTF